MSNGKYRPLLLQEQRIKRYPTRHLSNSSSNSLIYSTRTRGPSESSISLSSTDSASAPLLGRSRIGAHGRVVSSASSLGSENEKPPTAKDYEFRFPDEVFPPHFSRRQAITMGVCGAIGTGLFLGTGQPLIDAGPLGILLGYLAMSSVVYGYIVSVAEMVAAYPGSRGIVGLANRFVDPALGFALGWNAWYNWALMIPTQISCAMALIKYWNPPAWTAPIVPGILIFVVFAVSFGGGRMFASIISGFGIMKIVLILTLVVVSLFIDKHKAKEGSQTMWNNWDQPFSQYLGIEGAWGQFLGFWAVFMQAAHAFFAVETPLLVAQEVRDAPRVVLHLARRSWLLVTILYLAGVAVVGTLVPRAVLQNVIDPAPNSNSTASAAPWTTSPFLVAMEMAGPGHKVLMNLTILGIIGSALSAAAVETFLSARALYWMSYERTAPKLLTSLWFRNKEPAKGAVSKVPIPWLGLAITLVFASLSFLCMRPYNNVVGAAEKVFDFVNCMVAAAYFQSWVAALFTYLRFYMGTIKKLNKYPDEIKRIKRNRAWGQPFWAIYSFSVAVLVLTFNGWSLFNTKVGHWVIYYDPNQGPFPRDQGLKFITSYLPIPFIILLIFGYKFINQSELVRTENMDFSDVCDPDDATVCPEELKEHPPKGLRARLWWYLTS